MPELETGIISIKEVSGADCPFSDHSMGLAALLSNGLSDQKRRKKPDCLITLHRDHIRRIPALFRGNAAVRSIDLQDGAEVGQLKVVVARRPSIGQTVEADARALQHGLNELVHRLGAG